jgi:hypothetical protein
VTSPGSGGSAAREDGVEIEPVQFDQVLNRVAIGQVEALTGRRFEDLAGADSL